jgi:hypothetical protein
MKVYKQKHRETRIRRYFNLYNSIFTTMFCVLILIDYADKDLIKFDD